MSQRAVEFVSGGSVLKGVLHLPEETSGAALVCLHGLTLEHTMFADLGEALSGHGVTLLRFHMRGHHDSGGKLAEQGFFDELADALTALDFLKAQPGIDAARVGLLGFSLGGAVAAVASKKRQLKALATWGSLLDTSRWTDARYNQYGPPVAGIVRIWDDIPVSARLFSEAIESDPFKDALEFEGPYLAAHGMRDKNHPPEKSVELVAARKALGRPAEGYFPEKSGHKFQIPEIWAELNHRTAAFFNENL